MFCLLCVCVCEWMQVSTIQRTCNIQCFKWISRYTQTAPLACGVGMTGYTTGQPRVGGPRYFWIGQDGSTLWMQTTATMAWKWLWMWPKTVPHRAYPRTPPRSRRIRHIHHLWSPSPPSSLLKPSSSSPSPSSSLLSSVFFLGD